MATVTVSPRASARPDTELPASRLRAVLVANSATSLVGGLVALVAAGWVTDTMGLGSVAVTRGVGMFLLLFAAAVGYAARNATGGLRPATLAISSADIAWVVATAGVVAAADLSTAGVVIAVVMAIGVADFAVVQLWMWRRLA